MSTNIETARRYLQALESGASGERLAAFFHPDVIQQEFPNRLVPQGKTMNLRELHESAERGQKVLESQRYEVHTAVADGDQVALELEWTGTLKIALGTLPAGATMRARCATFLTFREGRILSQHSYDCFEPF